MSTLNISVLMNVHLDFRMVIPNVDRTMIFNKKTKNNMGEYKQRKII